MRIPALVCTALALVATIGPLHAGSRSTYVVGATEPGTPWAIYDTWGMQLVGRTPVDVPSEGLAIGLNTVDGVGFVGFGSTPGTIVKVRLGAGDALPTVLSRLTLEEGEGPINCVAMDPAGRRAWFGTFGAPDLERVVMVTLGDAGGPVTRVGALGLPLGDSRLYAAAYSQLDQHAYFITGTKPGRLLRLSTGTGNSLPGYSGSLTLATGEDETEGFCIDPAGTTAFIGTEGPGNSVAVKVSLGNGEGLPVRVGAVAFPEQDFDVECASYDPIDNRAYFATGGNMVVKVAPGKDGGPPELVGDEYLGDIESYASAFDPDGRQLYVSSVGQIAAVNPGAPDDPPTLDSVLPTAEPGYSIALDTAHGYGYCGSKAGIMKFAMAGRTPGRRLRLSRVVFDECADSVELVGFHSYRAVGHLRLFLYDSSEPRQLLWQSDEINNVAEAQDILVPIAAGHPDHLALQSGTYWVGWMSDSEVAVGTFTPGRPGDGASADIPYGPVPDSLAGEQLVADDKLWTEYIKYLRVDSPARDIAAADFADGPQGWQFLDVAPIFTAPISSGGNGAISLAATNNTNTFGWWESPVYDIQRPFCDTEVVLLRADFSLSSDLSTPDQVPNVRLRSSAENSQQSDVMSIESNSGSHLSPTTAGRTLSMYWVPAPASPRFGLEFDLLNFLPDDAATATVRLDGVALRRLAPPRLNQLPTRREFTFDSSEEGFAFHSLPGLFTSAVPSYDHAGGGLVLHYVPTNGFEFSWWGSPETGPGVFHPLPGRVYFVEFTVSSSATTASSVPGFRLRVNESGFQLSQCLVVASTADGANSPTLGNPMTYTVAFPTFDGIGDHLIFSLDSFMGSGDGDDTQVAVRLDSVRIRGALPTQSITLPDASGMALLEIPSGSFRMGSPTTEASRQPDEGPVHDVTLSHPIFAGATEVTQAQWNAVLGLPPPATDANLPVTNITWEQAHQFLDALNAWLNTSGQGTLHFRLPTEAEWEYTCRAGTTTRFSFGDALDANDDCDLTATRDPNLWYCGNSDSNLHDVGMKTPNPWDIADMHGNAWEWCEDWYGSYHAGSFADPAGPASGTKRVVRGGSADTADGFGSCRSANRYSLAPNDSGLNVGFRIVATKP